MNYKLAEKILTALLAFLPVTYIYLIPGTGMVIGVILLLVVVFPLSLLLFNNSGYKYDKTHIYYLLFVLYLFIISLVNGSIGNMVMLFLISVPFQIFITSNKNLYGSFLKYYLYLSLFFSIFLIIQAVSLFIFSYPIEGLLLAIPRVADIESSITDEILYVRLASVFAEPSHFALYVIPSVCILLWDIVSFRFRKFALLAISTAVIVSTSGNGIILLAIVYILFALYVGLRKVNYKSITIVACIICVGIFIFNSEFMQGITGSLFSDDMGYDKSEYRIKRGFMLYNDLPAFDKLIGVGWGNAEKYSRENNTQIYGKYSAEARFDYFNSISGILIYTGMVGFVLFVLFFMSLYRKTTNYGSKVILLVIFITLFSSSIFMAEQWLLYLMLVYSTSHIKFSTRFKL